MKRRAKLEFKVGDKVLLQLGTEFKYAPRGLQRWDGCQFVVSRAKYIDHGWIYELASCKSANGVPYAIMEEWLLLMR